MTISKDEAFQFDVQGFLHLRGVMAHDELAAIDQWIDELADLDVKQLNSDDPSGMAHQLNRPISRLIDAAPQFAVFLDHPATKDYLEHFLGPDYRHIDNELYHTHPGYQGGGWHRGVAALPGGYVRDRQFDCLMVKVFYCISDVGPGQGEFVVVPGSHKAAFEIDMSDRIDLPGQHVFDDVKAGDVIIFNEGLLHNGRPNPSNHTRKTIIVNFGRQDAGVWAGYRPKAATLQAVSPNQRAILTNPDYTWQEMTHRA